jgi:2-octaprenyl-6-methoxyphenol hydroxylase
MAAALALAKAGFEVMLAAPPSSKVDHRTTTLMLPSIQFLESMGVWQDIMPSAAPLTTMRIVDGTNRLVRSRTVSFQAAEIQEDAFGWNMPNSALNDSLARRIAQTPSITVVDGAVQSYSTSTDQITATLADGTTICAKLVVGADGRNSIARNAAQIETRNWSYPQTAFVTVFSHRLPHASISTEFHTEDGPCVQVPLPGNNSSLVWVVKPEYAQALLAMDDEALSLAIEQKIGSILGKVTAKSARQTYPLSGQYPVRFAKNRVALVGEAAHVFPPLGAQGLNLGLRDVEDLVIAATRNPVDPGALSVLNEYDTTRRPDILARTGAVDALNRSLLSTLLPAQIARSVGLAVLDMAAPLRGLFMREGMRPGSGISAFGASFRENIRRKITLRDEVK